MKKKKNFFLLFVHVNVLLQRKYFFKITIFKLILYNIICLKTLFSKDVFNKLLIVNYYGL